MGEVYFGAVDYTIFIISLCVSIGIGIYFGCCGNKKQSANEYLYGNKQMNAIPVGLSLYSSAISALSIIGIPAEIYDFGSQYIMGIFAIPLAFIIVWFTVIPVFCGNLDIKTPYEYFARRFGTNVFILSSFIYVIQTMLLMPVIIFAPAIAFSQATHIPVLVCTTFIGGICIIYTTIGGFKSVIWTDSLQATLMLLTCVALAIIGVNNAGGIAEVWRIAVEGKRVQFFNMNPNPFIRTSFWSSIIGVTFIQISHFYCSAAALQRYMSLPNEKEAKICVLVGGLGGILMRITCCVCGFALYALYRNCDLVTSQQIKTTNRIVPYFVMHTIKNIPGFTGLFNACLFSAALSSLSSEMNTVGGLVYYNFILKITKNKFVKDNGPIVMKIIVCITGIIYLSLIPSIQNSKHIYELALSLGGITFGAKLGILCLGILFPKANSKGTICGALTSMAVIAWIDFGSHHYNTRSFYKLGGTSLANCTDNLRNITIPTTRMVNDVSDIFILYRLSFLYITLFGTIITITVGLVVSYLTGPNDIHKMDPLLVVPFLRPYVLRHQEKSSEMQIIECKKYVK